MYKEDLALNNPQRLICHKTKLTNTLDLCVCTLSVGSEICQLHLQLLRKTTHTHTHTLFQRKCRCHSCQVNSILKW